MPDLTKFYCILSVFFGICLTSLDVKANDLNQSPEITVHKIDLLGDILVSPIEIQSIIAPFSNRKLSLKDLEAAANQITQLYVKRGYLTSRVIVPDQVIQSGTAKLISQVGTIEKIEVEKFSDLDRTLTSARDPILEKIDVLKIDPKRRKVTQEDTPDEKLQNYITSRIRYGIDRPFNAEELENDLKLLKSDNSFFQHLEASLREGTNGRSILTIRVEKKKPFRVVLTSDNNSPPSIGGERLGSTMTQRHLLTLGDSLSASYFRSLSGGLNAFDFAYQIPLNPRNGTLEFRYSPSHSRITDSQFERFGIRANSTTYELNYRQPLYRRFESEFALSLGLTLQDGQTFLYDKYPFPFGIGPDENGNSRTRVLQFGQDYTYRTDKYAWALRSQFNLGLGIFNSTQNSNDIPDGQFMSWQGQVQHVKQLGNYHLLIGQLDLQLTPNSLLPSQQFTLGGGKFLRGYRQGLRTGDNGFRLSLEDRISLYRNVSGRTTLHLAPFVDLGATWNHPNNPNLISGENFLASIGLGLLWQPTPKLLMRLDYGLPLIKTIDRSQNLQDQALYFRFEYEP